MKISVVLEALTATFETDIDRANKAAARAFKQMQRDAETAAKWIGTGLVAAAAGAGFAIKHAIDEMDRMNKAAQKIGVSTEFLSGLEYAAKLADVSTEGLGTALKKLAVNMEDAASRDGEMRALFRDTLHVDVTKADGSLRNVGDVFEDLSDRMAGFNDGAGKAALSVKVLGRAGNDLIPLMNGGAEGLRAARKEAEAFGVIVSGPAAAAAEEFNDNMSRLQTQMAGAAIQAATQLLPVLEDLSKQWIEMANDPAFREDLANAIKTLGEVAIWTVEHVVKLANAFGFLYKEGKQLLGIVDDDDWVRLNEELEAAEENLRKLKGQQVILPTPGEIQPITLQVDDSLVREAEKRVDDLKQKLDALNAVNAHTAQQNRARAATEQFRADSTAFLGTSRKADAPILRDPGAQKEQEKAAKELAKLKLDALGDEAKSVEELAQKYAKLDELQKKGAVTAAEAAKLREGLARQQVEPLRLGSLTDEQRAVIELQAKYTELDNLVANTALTRAEADKIGAGYAQQWRDAEEQKILNFREATGTITQQASALAALQEQFRQIQDLVDAGSGGLPGGISGVTQEQADKLKADAQAKFDQVQEQAKRDTFSSLSSGLLEQGEYDLSPLEQQLRAEEDAINESYARRQADQLTAEGLTQEQLTDLAKRSQQARDAALADLDTRRTQGQLQMWGDAFGQLATLMSSHNKKLFMIGKAGALAQAVVNIAQGITEALKLPWPVNLVAAIATGVAGAVQVATIAGAQPPAYDLGGRIPAGALGLVGERGTELAGRGAAGGNARALREAMKTPPVRITDSTLITKPTLIKGPAHITSRVETARLMAGAERERKASARVVAQDRSIQAGYAGMFDQGGMIPAGRWGVAGEFGTERASGRAIATPTVSPALTARSTDSDRDRKPDKHVHVWNAEALADEAIASEAWERVIVHHFKRNETKIRQGR